MEFFAISNGIPIHILDTKKGDITIMLLHGYLETLYIYSQFIELLQKTYRVIAIDLPGHGLSGSDKEINTMDFAADIAVDVLINVCKVTTPVYIAGHSMGGYIAQACMKSHRDKFNGLILLNSTPFADNPDKKTDRLREIELVNNAKLNALAALSIPKMYATENLRRMDEKIEETIEITETHDPNGIVACIKGLMERADNVELLTTFHKILFIFGDRDKFISNEKAAEISAKYPLATTVIIPATGHNSFVEDPEKVEQAIKKFTE
ncbi:MAG: alpha/beta hydrolase [Bacteroidales bacterium]